LLSEKPPIAQRAPEHSDSTAELERRWKAVRAAMADMQIDVPVMQNNQDHMGG
jgi:hypothetical protein